MYCEIQVPRILRIGGGCVAELADILRLLGCERPLIVTDPFMCRSGLADKIAATLNESGIHSRTFSKIVAEPTTRIVDAGVAAFLQFGHDSLISLGGGSPIDTAKAISMLSVNGGICRSYKVPHAIPLAGAPHIAIPTTAGTGSEVTRFTIVTDSDTSEKMLIAGSTLLPTASLVDFELTLTMPPRLIADTGIDSLTHALEAYVSRHANPFSDAMAIAAMRDIWKFLPTAFFTPSDKESREILMTAATLAGMAFSNASVALVHGMSRPIGGHFHVPHGLSNAMLLPAVTRFSASGAPRRYAACARAMGIVPPTGPEAAAVEQLMAALFELKRTLQVPSPKTFGIDEQKYRDLIPTMAQEALASGSPGNNPRVPTLQQIEALYQEIWDDERSQ